MVNNELNPQGQAPTPEDLNRFLDQARDRNASYNSIVRGATAMGFDQDSVRKTMYNRSERMREDNLNSYRQDLINLRLEKQRMAAANERLKELEELKKKGQSESGSTPDGVGSGLSLSQQIVDADNAFLTEWDKRQLLLDYEKAINTNDNNFEVQRLQNQISETFGVDLGYEKKEGLEKFLEDLGNVSLAEAIRSDKDDSAFFGKTGKDIAVGFGNVIDFINPAAALGKLGSMAMSAGKPIDFNPEYFEKDFSESRSFIKKQLEATNAKLNDAISLHNEINTQLGYNPNFDPTSRADMQEMYSEILERDFNLDEDSQFVSEEVSRLRGLDRGYINNMARGMVDRRATSAVQSLDAVAEFFKEGGLSGLGLESIENWADRGSLRDAARRQVMIGDAAKNEKGIVESFLDGDIADGLKKFGIAAPDLISQVVTLVATKGKARKLALGWMGVQAGGNYYAGIKGREDLTSGEKLFQSTAIGVAEFTLEKMFMGAENAAREGISKLRPKNVVKGKKDNLNKALADIRAGRKKIAVEGAKGFGSEAIEEGAMNLIEQNLETFYDIAEGRKTAADAMREFNGYEFADSLLLGGIMGGTTRSIGALASNIGHSRVIKKVEEERGSLSELEAQYKKEKDPVMKDLLRMKILEGQERLYNLHSVADQMYGRFTVEDGDKVIALNQRLSKIRDDIKSTKDREVREELKKEFKSLYEQKSEIESKYITQADIDQIEDKTPFSEANLREEERKAKENGGQYEMTFPDETGKPQTVQERALSAAEVRAQQLMQEVEKKLAEKEGDEAKAQTSGQQQTETRKPDQQTQSKKAEENSVRSSAGEPIVITAEDLLGTELSSTTVSNVNSFLNNAAPALKKTGTKVVLHRTQESFDASSPVADKTFGYYNSNTNEIHLPPAAANKDIREEFGHAILYAIIGPGADPKIRKQLFEEAKRISPKIFNKRYQGYLEFYKKEFERGGMSPEEASTRAEAKAQEEVIIGVIREGEINEGVLDKLRTVINRMIERLFGKDHVIKSTDSLKQIAAKYNRSITFEKSTLDVEGATRPAQTQSEPISAALKGDPVAGREIILTLNLSETKFGDRFETSQEPKAYRFNDYRHFSNWYAKITGNSNPDLVGRVSKMYYVENGKKVEVPPPPPILNRDGSKKYVRAVESNRAKFHRLRHENRQRQADKSQEYSDMREMLEDVMRRYAIFGEVDQLSEFGNTREGLVDARKTVMDILEQRGSIMDEGRLVNTLSGLDVSEGNVTFINSQGFSVGNKPAGAPLLITSASQTMPIGDLTASSIKSFADANVVEMELTQGYVGVSVDGDNVTLTMNHPVPEVYKENLIKFAEREGMPSIYSSIDGEVIPVTDNPTYRGIGRRDAVVDAVADLKRNKMPVRKNVKPIVSPAAGTVESIGVISPSLKSVQKQAKEMGSPSIPISPSTPFVKIGEALKSKSKRGLENKVGPGYAKGLMVADLTNDELLKRLDGCEFITVAYDQTGQTVVSVNGREYNINSGVRGAMKGEIMSHRSAKTRQDTADAIQEAALKAQAKGKEVVILYTAMGEGGIRTNPFVGRMILEEALLVSKESGLESSFYESFAEVFNKMAFESKSFETLLLSELEDMGLLDDNDNLTTPNEEQYRKIIDLMAKPREEGSLGDREATFRDRGSLMASMLGQDLKMAMLKRVGAEKSAEYQDKIIKGSDLKSIADPALTNAKGGEGKLAKTASVVALQFVDPMIALLPRQDGDGFKINRAWGKSAFSEDAKAAFQFAIQGGDGVMLTSHHITLDVWSPKVMEGRSEASSITTVHKGKQTGTLKYEPATDVVSASLKSLKQDSDISPEGNFEVRERTPFQIAKDTVIRKLQNKFRELMVLQEDVEAYRGKLDASQDFRLKETLFYGKAANDLEALEQKVSELKKIMKDEGVDSGELGDYMYALHVKERNALIKEREGVENGSGKSDAWAQELLDGLTPEKRESLEKGAKVLRDIMQGTRDTLRQFGLSTNEEVDEFESQFENYVPLAGIAKDEEIDGSAYPTGGAGMAVYRSPVKKAKGRKYEAQEVVAQVIAQAANTAIHARKNEALEALYNMVVNNPNPAVWKVTGVAEYGDRSVVPVRINGEKKYIKFTNTHYADSLNGMTVEKTNTFIKILRAPSNWLRRSFTTLDPEFVISNFARDIQSAIFNATADAELDGNGMNAAEVRNAIVRRVFPLMKSLLKGAAGKDMSQEHRVFYEEFKADGGKTGWAYAKPLEQIAEELQENPDTAARRIMGSIEKVTDFIEGVNDAVENSIRLSAYIAARENGVSREKAAVFAKNITVNFNKSGEMGQVANAVYLFFNASVQGTARIAKSMTLKPKFKDSGEQRSWQERVTGAQKLAMSLTLLNAMLAAVNESFSDDDEDDKSFYSKISDYEKERNMIIMVGGKNYIKIPMPYGYNVFANLGTAITEVTMGTREIDDALMFLLSSAFGSFSPISFGQSKDVYGMLEKGLAPTVAKPFIEVANNETFFGSQVYAKQFPGATPKPESQMSFRAPKFMRDLFEFMNEVSGGSEFKSGWFDKNPDKAWYLFEYFLGGAGRFVTRTGEIVQKASNKAFVDGDVDLEFNDAPILRKMYGEASRYYDYDLFEKNSMELAQLYKEMTELGVDRSRHKGVYPLNEVLKKTKKQLKVLRAKRREARQIEGYAERTVRLQELMEKERKILMNFNKIYEERRK